MSHWKQGLLSYNSKAENFDSGMNFGMLDVLVLGKYLKKKHERAKSITHIIHIEPEYC